MASSPPTVARSTSTSSSMPPATTSTSSRRSTSADATGRPWPGSGVTVRALTGRDRPRIPEPVHHVGAQLQSRAWSGRQLLDGGACALIVECLQLMALRGATTIEVTQRAFDDYVAGIDEAMQRTVWCHTPNAHTYYRSGSAASWWPPRSAGRLVASAPAPIDDDFILQ